MLERDFCDAVGRKSKPNQQTGISEGTGRCKRIHQKLLSDEAAVEYVKHNWHQERTECHCLSLPVKGWLPSLLLCLTSLSHQYLLCFLHLLYITQAESSFWLLSTPSFSNFLTYSPSRGSEAICRLLIWAVLSVLSAGGGETIMVLGECAGCRPLGRG